MTDMQVLNASLFNKLIKIFGEVNVHKSGENLHLSVINGRISTSGGWGECYSVNCPFCNDSKKHLWISHAFGTKTKEGKILYPAVCYRNNCLSKIENRKILIRRIKSPLGIPLYTERINKETKNDQSGVVEVNLPEPSEFLNKLPQKHQAVEYVISRGFDPDWLSNHFGVKVYIGNNVNLRERLIIPIFESGKLVGWLGRSYTNADPKYYNMPGLSSSRILFNVDKARMRNEFVVLVEGVFDVFRMTKIFAIGQWSPFVALLGSSLSEEKRKFIEKHWKKIYIALDNDAEVKAKEMLRKFTNRETILLKIPYGDPDVFGASIE